MADSFPTQSELQRLLPFLTAPERAELDRLLTDGMPIWTPLAGPQTMAYESAADVIGYGGAAGGGKTDLACGLALTRHTVTAIFRREATQLTGVIDRLTALLGNRSGYNGSERIWRLDDRQIEFGSTPHTGDEAKYQGRPKDLLVIDEAANFLESQVRFLMGWVRSTKPGQKCSTLMTFNPPTSAEGQWITKYFGPWLVEEHPNPAQAGELRWYATVDGKDFEVADNRRFVLVGGQRVYDFDPDDFLPVEIIKPLSRTFIPSRISDNPYLMETGYMATLQSLPEPLRSQMLKGDFKAGLEDDPWQVIPSAWVKAAQDRWKPRDAKGVMDSLGVDVSRGGRDETIISRRHGRWFDELVCLAGTASPDGPTVAGQILTHRRDLAPVHIDIVGWGSSPYDFLVSNRVQVIGVNGAAKPEGIAKEGGLTFHNRRAELLWRAREELAPTNPHPIALPPCPQLRADLCAPKWSLKPSGILVESKEELKARIGRSPDRGDAVCMALISTPKADPMAWGGDRVHHDFDPF